MVKLNKIYTKTGDKGTTGLGDGRRVAKHDLRVEAYGTVDEANAALGAARLHAEAETDRLLARLQNDLFDLGADLCCPEKPDEVPGKALRVTPAQVAALEKDIDRINAALAPLTSFVLPAGTALSVNLHLARTLVRRAERRVTELAETETVSPQVVSFLNRLSDLLFVMARAANAQGKADVLWVPGGAR